MPVKTLTFATSGANIWTVPNDCYIVYEAFLVSGGGGGGAGGAANGGSGGGGGRVRTIRNVAVTPGANTTVTVGAGGNPAAAGQASSIGALSIAGGAAGGSNGGTGGASSRNLLGTTTNTTGAAAAAAGGGGGAGAGGNGSGINGGPGYLYPNTIAHYGGGGGGGIPTFIQTTPRPILPGVGGVGGGGNGGGEDRSSVPGTDNAAIPGTDGLGGGGGGGQAAGFSQESDPAPPNNDDWLPSTAKTGARGGSGIVILTYNSAEFSLTSSAPGVAEGQSITINLQTRHVPNGATVNYTIGGNNITANDFVPSTLSGSFTVSATTQGDGTLVGSASIVLSIREDAFTESDAGLELATLTLQGDLAFISFFVGDFSKSPVDLPADNVENIVVGKPFRIVSSGTTVFTALGAPDNNAGTEFTATATGRIFGSNLVEGRSYTILTPSTTDYTMFGAPNNNTATIFIAVNQPPRSVVNIFVGKQYVINSAGNTNFVQIGAEPTISCTGTITGNTLEVDFVNSGAITVGTFIVGTGVTAGSFVTEFVTGTGGVGSYTLNTTSTVSTSTALSGFVEGQIFISTSPGIGTGTVTAGEGEGVTRQGTGTVSGLWTTKRVQTNDYNSIRSKVASVLGSDTISFPLNQFSNYGYGQAVLSNTVSTASRVTVSAWNSLRNDIINAWVHIFGTTPPLTLPAENDTIRANLTTSPYLQYEAYADVIVANRFGLHPSQSQTVNKGSVEASWPGAFGATWTGKISASVTVTFTSAANARHFFNSGGEIRFAIARAGSTSTPQDNAWQNLINSVGVQAFGGNKPLSGRGSGDAKNYYRLSSSVQYWYTASASSPYGSNIFRISARTPGVTDNTNGTSAIIEFGVEWIDDNLTRDPVTGAFSLSVSTLEAVGFLQPAGAGSFTVQSPAVVVSSIQP
jgi:hypothetical protein